MIVEPLLVELLEEFKDAMLQKLEREVDKLVEMEFRGY